jgi:hypothetical protein
VDAGRRAQVAGVSPIARHHRSLTVASNDLVTVRLIIMSATAGYRRAVRLPARCRRDRSAEAVPIGTTQFGLGVILLTIGGRMVFATENALINTLETPLAVAWVWVCFSEAPSVTSLVAGIIVLAASAAHVWYSNRTQIVPATG